MTMTRADLLNAVIADGIAEIQKNYTKPHQLAKRNGGIAGFEDCKGKTDEEMKAMLDSSKLSTEDFSFPFAFVYGDEQYDCYWYDRSYQAQIEWVLNVLSAANYGQGREPATDFTLRGFLKAADILSRNN